MDAILASLYDVISGPAGAPRNWERFRSLFAPGARLVPLVTPQGATAELRTLTPDGYIERSAGTFAKSGFYEKEVARRVETFGGLTHVWSTYEARRAASDAEPFLSGINSIQLLQRRSAMVDRHGRLAGRAQGPAPARAVSEDPVDCQPPAPFSSRSRELPPADAA